MPSERDERVAAADRPAGPDPQGAPPAGSPPPAAGTPPSGPSPTGHPPTSPAAAPLEADPEVEDAGARVVDDLDELKKLEKQRDEYLGSLQRLQADFENYRKRVMKQQAEHLERAAEGVVEKLLDVLDTFDLALAHESGFDQVHAKLLDVLAKEGLERIDPSGAAFDPNEHDAVAHEEGDGGDGPTVSEVLRAGYRWKGRVLRPAMVKVRG